MNLKNKAIRRHQWLPDMLSHIRQSKKNEEWEEEQQIKEGTKKKNGRTEKERAAKCLEKGAEKRGSMGREGRKILFLTTGEACLETVNLHGGRRSFAVTLLFVVVTITTFVFTSTWIKTDLLGCLRRPSFKVKSSLLLQKRIVLDVRVQGLYFKKSNEWVKCWMRLVQIFQSCLFSTYVAR